MKFVLLANHTPETCPTSNATTRGLFLKFGPEIPALAKKAGVKILAGPLVNWEHMLTTVVEADKTEAVYDFVSATELGRWNSVRILPSQTIDEGLKEIAKSSPIF